MHCAGLCAPWGILACDRQIDQCVIFVFETVRGAIIRKENNGTLHCSESAGVKGSFTK